MSIFDPFLLDFQFKQAAWLLKNGRWTQSCSVIYLCTICSSDSLWGADPWWKNLHYVRCPCCKPYSGWKHKERYLRPFPHRARGMAGTGPIPGSVAEKFPTVEFIYSPFNSLSPADAHAMHFCSFADTDAMH